MNWMTSGRKRAQRSKKTKELRAKHFVKVAADRARAIPQPIRATSSSTSRQSADVSRLKSRWTQAIHQQEQNAAGGTAAAADSSAPRPEADPISPAVDIDAAVGSTPKGPFRHGVLDLDTTPPLGDDYREFRQRGAPNTPTALLISGTFSDPVSYTRLAQHPQHAHRSRPLLSAAVAPISPAVEGRQLVFGGSRVAEGGSLGDGYDGQLLGSEGDPAIESSRVVLPPNSEDGAADDISRSSSDHWGRFGMAKDNPMRFFDSGVELALDGSPLSANTISPSGLRGVSSVEWHAPSRVYEVKETTSPGAAGSAGGRGLPKFAAGGLYENRVFPTTPMSTEADCSRGPHDDNAALGRQIPAHDHGGLPRTAEALECSGFTSNEISAGRPPGENCEGAEVGLKLRPNSTLPSESHPNSAAFEVLARTWGLFGGALASPPTPTDGTGVDDPCSNHRPSPSFAGGEYRGPEEYQKESEAQDIPCQKAPRPGGGASANGLARPGSPSSPHSRSASPELVMLWDVGEDPSKAQCSTLRAADQGQGSGVGHRLSPTEESSLASASNGPVTDIQQGALSISPCIGVAMASAQQAHEQRLSVEALLNVKGVDAPETTRGLPIEGMTEEAPGVAETSTATPMRAAKERVPQCTERRKKVVTESGGTRHPEPRDWAISIKSGHVSTLGDETPVRDDPRTPSIQPSAGFQKRGAAKVVRRTPEEVDAPSMALKELHLEEDGALSTEANLQYDTRKRAREACVVQDGNATLAHSNGGTMTGKRVAARRLVSGQGGYLGGSRAVAREFNVLGGGAFEEMKEIESERRKREDEHSTVVWYRTIVACLMAAS